MDADRGEWTEIVLNLLDESANLLDAFRAYREEIDYDPNRLTEVEERLHLIHSLERKYGATIDGVLAFAERIRAELETIENADERIRVLAAEAVKRKEALSGIAERLSLRRRDYEGRRDGDAPPPSPPSDSLDRKSVV